MKNKIKYIPLIAAFLTFSGCLDMNPISDIGEGGYYKNQEQIYQAVMACYNGLQKPLKNEWQLTELRTDNSRLEGSGSSASTSKNINMMDMFRVETSHPINTTYWDDTYHNIANCNTVLQHLGAVEDPKLQLTFESEARFIRAYHYFNLVRLYGPLFIVTERISGDEAKQKERSTVNDVYEFIISELDFTSKNLPDKISETEKGRVDQWAAKTLLGKVYLTLGNYAEARKLLLEVEDTSQSGYDLLPDYASVFSIDNEMNKEIIFAVRYKAGNVGLGSSFANDFAPANSSASVIDGGGSGFNCPTQDLINTFSSEDKRKVVCLEENWVNDAGNPVYVPWVKKYFSDVAVKNDAENDWIVLRYADVLLMLAEIENELSSPSVALPRLNKIRARAGLEPLESSDVPDKYRFRNALLDERRLEFAFENHRFFDLVRTNQLIAVMQKHFDTEEEPAKTSGLLTSFYKDKDKSTYLPNSTLEEWQLLLPIPLNVMTVSPNASQNPHY